MCLCVCAVEWVDKFGKKLRHMDREGGWKCFTGKCWWWCLLYHFFLFCFPNDFCRLFFDFKNQTSHKDVDDEPGASDHKAKPNSSVLNRPAPGENVSQGFGWQGLWLKVAEWTNPMRHCLQRPNDACTRRGRGQRSSLVEPLITTKNQIRIEWAKNHHHGSVLLFTDCRHYQAWNWMIEVIAVS